MAALDDIKAALAQNLGKALREATSGGLDKFGKDVQDLVEDFFDISIQKNLARQKVNESLAKEMQADTLAAYQSNVISEKRVGSYRAGAGRFPTALGTALADEEFAVGTGVGIAFANIALLNKAARHWHRLNFGALPNAEGLAAPSFAVSFGNASFPVRLTDSPSGGFSVPNSGNRIKGTPFGFFNSAGELHIGRGGPDDTEVRGRPSTRGIGARRFLDAGLGALARNFEPAYRDYLNTVAADFAAKSNGKDITK